MCNNCIHAPVCGKCRATGGQVGKCEHFKEERRGRWEPDIEVFDADPAVGVPGGELQTGWKCSVCGRCEPEKEPYCHCGARMDGEQC